jgi:hypothetical protein
MGHFTSSKQPDNPVSLQKIETMIKMMTCKQLGGACDLEFKAETFEEIAALSRAHAQKMIQQKDKAHGEAMPKNAAVNEVS